MTTLNVIPRNEAVGVRFPLYCKYGGLNHPQCAFVYLDIRTGDCSAGFSKATGSTPENQWNNLLLAFKIRTELTVTEIAQVINHNAANFQLILDDSTIEQATSGTKGVFGNVTHQTLENMGFYIGSNLKGHHAYPYRVIKNEGDFPAFIGDDIFPCSGQTPEDYATQILKEDGIDLCYFSDELNNQQAILYALCDLWAERLYSDLPIPVLVTQYLLKEGTCDHSNYTKKLKAFAA